MNSKQQLRKEWSMKHESCIECGTTERRHFGRGLCTACYQRYYYHKGNPAAYKKDVELKRQRYREDKVYRADKLEKNKIYHRTEKGREVSRRSFKRMLEKYPDKYKARWEVRKALLRGYIVKPSHCRYENEVHQVKRLEAHHFDYNRPLDVIWLCSKHHKKLHYQI